MKNIGKIDRGFIIITLLVSIITLVNIYVLYSVPIFSDGTVYAKTTVDIVDIGGIPNQLPHLPNFFLIGAVLTLFIKDVEIVLAILNVIPILLLIVLMYSIVSKQFNKQVGLYTAVFLSFTPMFLWVTSHRLIDPLTYFFPILFIWTYLNFIRYFKYKDGILISLFLASMIGLKLTLLPFVIGIVFCAIYLFFKNSKEQRIKLIKSMGIIILITTIFIIPYLQYWDPVFTGYFNPPEKVAEEYITSLLPTQKLEQIDQTQEAFITKQGTLPYIQDHFKKYEITGILQYFSILPVYKNARGHWFSPLADVMWSIFLIIFIGGIIYWIKEGCFKTPYSKFLIITSIGIIPFMHFFAIMRYLFYINIMTSVFFGLGFYYITKKLKTPRFVRVVMTMIVIVFLSVLIVGEVNDIIPYKNSYGHNIVREGGMSELSEVKSDIPTIVGATIFTPSAEPAYYLEGKTMWDWRLFFVDGKTNILNYFEYYNITYIIIPRYSLSPKIWDGHTYVDNTLDLFANPIAIPHDSTFYYMLQDNSTFQEIGNYKAFIIYKSLY